MFRNNSFCPSWRAACLLRLDQHQPRSRWTSPSYSASQWYRTWSLRCCQRWYHSHTRNYQPLENMFLQEFYCARLSTIRVPIPWTSELSTWSLTASTKGAPRFFVIFQNWISCLHYCICISHWTLHSTADSIMYKRHSLKMKIYLAIMKINEFKLTCILQAREPHPGPDLGPEYWLQHCQHRRQRSDQGDASPGAGTALADHQDWIVQPD